MIFVSAITFALLALNYGVLFPTMVDRSLSVHLVLELYQAPNHNLDIAQIKNKLDYDYIIAKRLKEQSTSNLIKIVDEQVYLTRKGKILAAIFYLDGKIFNVPMDRPN